MNGGHQNRYLEANDRPEACGLAFLYLNKGLDIVPTVHGELLSGRWKSVASRTNIGNLNQEIRAANRTVKSIRQLIKISRLDYRAGRKTGKSCLHKGAFHWRDLEAFLESSGKSAADYHNQMKQKEAKNKVIGRIFSQPGQTARNISLSIKVPEDILRKQKEKFKQEHPEVAGMRKPPPTLPSTRR